MCSTTEAYRRTAYCSNNSFSFATISTVGKANYNFIAITVKSNSKPIVLNFCCMKCSNRSKTNRIVRSVHSPNYSPTLIPIALVCVNNNHFIVTAIKSNSCRSSRYGVNIYRCTRSLSKSQTLTDRSPDDGVFG